MYQYSGPRSTVTLRIEGRDVTERLVPGRQYDLPSDNGHIQALVARGHLTPVQAASPAARSEQKKTKSKPAPATVTGSASSTLGGV